ncbi:MAG: bifunctional alpha,alpha-trehalose-phosphate synthase (UDP-forming)/trehalose-phosphatase [Candidatus Aminicenantes bacterium]|nr:bifunctional alpha,alpha-trehalose-phosphate synthase (UDP-forming)/trehalose-phosphatase [Candidatus Aminicenantes bacterium]
MSVVRREQSLLFESSVGGLATGLAQFYKSEPSAWVGWPGIPLSRIDDKEKRAIRERLMKESCHPVFLTGYEVDHFYHGFANRTIWPLFHYFPLHTVYNKVFWQVYENVNEKFADAVAGLVRPGDKIWIHDYHLLLLPELIRRRKPEAAIGFFLHIPFPSYELFRLLPWREAILRGLLGADLVGFHTESYGRHFIESASRILGVQAGPGRIRIGPRTVKVGAFPMGIHFERFSSASSDPRVRREVEKIEKRCVGRKIILSVDRLDYSKGIPQRLEAYELFLEKHPAWREKVTLIMIAVPSRVSVPTYAQLKKSVDESVGRINGRFGTIGWVPIWYHYRALPFESLASHYRAADVCLVTPLRDGMNLIAKEYLASRDAGDGVLVLSEMAGSAAELGGSILVNPNNVEEMAEAVKEALSLNPAEQVRRNEPMRRLIESHTVVRWARDFLAALVEARNGQRVL